MVGNAFPVVEDIMEAGDAMNSVSFPPILKKPCSVS
jgi:hypothetical protein